ncbi:MAG: hypothetical protein IJ374_10230 [Lachnospiraceae bacterium]|nr:hypothetical protein [Lachnospiraceae bacterium]
MRKIQKILLGVFAFGVLLTGIGIGTALIEYSSLNYGGHKIIGEENLVTKTLEYEISDEVQKIILGSSSVQQSDITELMEDSEMPDRIIQYEVTYNEQRVRPVLWDDSSDDGTDEEPDVVRLYLGLKNLGNDFGAFMENKDMILNDLKQHKISTYETNYITKVVIKAHPDTMELINANVL